MKFTIRSFTQLSIVLLAVTIMSVSVLGNSAYSDHVSGSGGTIDVVAVEGSTTISINGTTDRSGEVIIKVLAPNRNLVSIDQLTPTGEGLRLGYSTTLNTSGPTWNQDGDYSITIQQSHGGCSDTWTESTDTHNTSNEYYCGQQFMENKYNHIVRVGVTSGTTSETSISIDYLIEHSEYYVWNQNTPVAKDTKKLKLTADGIQGSTTINVNGTTDKSDEVIIKVTAPNGNIVAIAQITPTGGSFAIDIEVGGPLWSQDGTYKVKARQGPTILSAFATADGSMGDCDRLQHDVAGDGIENPDLTSSATGNHKTCQITLTAGNNLKFADDDNTGWLAYQNSAEVEILDGHVVPEFGVIAAMILAVAIVSIIVVTAKTKLSLVPRY